MKDEKDILTEMDEYIEKSVRKLTKVQQRILNKMRHEGCFIVRYHDPKIKYSASYAKWKLVTPDLKFVQNVNARTISALDPSHIRQFEMGKYGILGRFYLVHEHLHHSSVLRAIAACERANKRANV